VAAVDQALQTQIRNIEADYGRTMPEWFDIIRDSGLHKHNEVVTMLKTDFAMAHGAAHRVSLLQRQASYATSATPDDADIRSMLYVGKRSALWPVHTALLGAVDRFGADITVVPKAGYASLRRAKQFAMVQPTTAARLDVGLILKGVTAGGRLEPAQKFNALFTHRVRITQVADVDAELTGWLRTAYDGAA